MTRPASNGSIIGATQDPTPTSAGGIWTLPAQLELQKQGKWIAPGYNISRSLRFDSARSNYLSRTPGSAGDRKTWTWSGWVKRSELGATSSYALFSTATVVNDANFNILMFANNDLRFTSATVLYLQTTQLFRDASAWYHIVFAVDTTQATSSDRLKLYVNGTQVTAFSTANYPSQNADLALNNNNLQTIGICNEAGTLNRKYNGYLAEVHFIDGQALDPSYFGVVDNLTGVWRPKQVEDMTYGTNGFYLPFSDNTSTTTLGYDQSGNSNNWTLSAGFSVAAGANNDSMVDVPTRYGTDTGAGGEVRGNYCTLNPLGSLGTTFTNGNLQANVGTANTYYTTGTMAVSSGKWYWEYTISTDPNWCMAGIVDPNSSSKLYTAASFYGVYMNSGQKSHAGVNTAYTTFAANDLIGVALDLDGGTITFYKNGVSLGTAFSGLSGTFTPVFSNAYTNAFDLVTNFGQRPWSYAAPAGFKALVTTNLPDPTVVQGDDYFNTVLYTGTGSSLGVTGVGFQPDFVWIKERSGTADHGLYDAVRGVQKQIESNTQSDETTESTGLTAFGTDGFTVGSLAQLNTNTDTYVAWNWKANGAGSSNTDGTISSTVSANTTAGISIVTYTGTGANATVGHGLGAVPSMIMVKARTAGPTNWICYHTSVGNTAAVFLNLTDASFASTTYWNDTSPTSSVFSVGTNAATNGGTLVAYCFAEVEGFSKFGSYTGNGSADGPFVYTGFRPRWILFKLTSGIDGWMIYDTARNPYNVVNLQLYPHSSSGEVTGISTQYVDILSNGFKIRGTDGIINGNTQNYIFAAFAENPFKNSLAR